MKINFTKMHGLGNDYIYVDCFREHVEHPEKLAVEWSDRHFGIGSDGLVLILPSDAADCRMRMFNADGSEGKMCGNAVRCVGKYVYDNRIARGELITVETLSGIKTLKMTVEGGVATAAEVDMGEPVLRAELIPVLSQKERFVDEQISVGGIDYRVTCVSMGNPHAVLFSSRIDELRLDLIGPGFERHELFPDRINTEFVEVIDENTLKMRVWERGSGETMACGTGACAVTVAAALNNLVPKGSDITVKLRGGDLIIRWDHDNRVYMRGPAEKVFDGTIEV